MRAEIFTLPRRWGGSIDEAVLGGQLTLMGAVVFEVPREGRWLGAKLAEASRAVGADYAEVVWLISRAERPVQLLRPEEWTGGPREAGYSSVSLSDRAQQMLDAYAGAARAVAPVRLIGRLVCQPLPTPENEVLVRAPALPLHQVFGDAVGAAGGRLGFDQAGEYAVVPRNEEVEALMQGEEAECRRVMAVYGRYRAMIDDILRRPRLGLRFDIASSLGEVNMLPAESIDRSRLFLLVDADDVPHLGVAVGQAPKVVRNSKVMTEVEAAILGIELTDPEEADATPAPWRMAADLGEGTRLPPDLHQLGGVIRYTGDVVEEIVSEAGRRINAIPLPEADDFGLAADDLLDVDGESEGDMLECDLA
jgi:hypothetical protein